MLRYYKIIPVDNNCPRICRESHQSGNAGVSWVIIGREYIPGIVNKSIVVPWVC